MSKRREPLRVPANWTGQDRQFVIQLERILDDIYGRFGEGAVSDVIYESSTLKKIINRVKTAIVSASTLKTDMSLDNVENKSSATIRGEITDSDIASALGYTPRSSAAANLEYYTLLTDTTLTSSYETVGTYNNRKFSDYNVIVFEFFRGSWCMGSIVMSRSKFTSSTGVLHMSAWGGTSIEYDVKYKSDTSVDVKKITTDTETQSVRIGGFALPEESHS